MIIPQNSQTAAFITARIGALVQAGTISIDPASIPSIVNAAGQWFFADLGHPEPVTPAESAAAFQAAIDALTANPAAVDPYILSAATWYQRWGVAVQNGELLPWNDVPWAFVPWEWLMGGGYAVDWANVSARLAGVAPLPLAPTLPLVAAAWGEDDGDASLIPWGLLDWPLVPWRKIPWEKINWTNIPATADAVVQAVLFPVTPGQFPPPTVQPTDPGGPGGDPAPPAPPKKKSNAGWIVAGIVGTVATVALVLAVKAK